MVTEPAGLISHLTGCTCIARATCPGPLRTTSTPMSRGTLLLHRVRPGPACRTVSGNLAFRSLVIDFTQRPGVPVRWRGTEERSGAAPSLSMAIRTLYQTSPLSR